MVKPRADAELIALDRQLDQLKRRAGRLRRRVEQGTAQWATWSSTMDEALRVVDRIAGTPAVGLVSIAVKISALRWFLEATDAILDAKSLRQLGPWAGTIVTPERRIPSEISCVGPAPKKPLAFGSRSETKLGARNDRILGRCIHSSVG